MSHFTVLVIGNNPEEQLAPFNENIEVASYIEYTKEELVTKERADLNWYNEHFYQVYLKDKQAYIEKHKSNQEHLNYLEKKFPEILKYSDEALYQYAIQGYSEDRIGKNGEIYSNYNPQSKWDWYMLGGRWKNYFSLKNGSSADVAKKKDIVFPIDFPFAIIKNGVWHERGQMKWFTHVDNAKSNEVWEAECKALIDTASDEEVFSLYDCHI